MDVALPTRLFESFAIWQQLNMRDQRFLFD